MNKSLTYSLMLLIGFCVAFNQLWGDTIYEDIQLSATDSTPGDEFGHSVSMDNGVAAIGAPFDDDNGTNSGAAYLFDVSTGEQIVKLLPLDGVAGAEFGFSIAINNGIVAVGARTDDENGINAGAAYLFDASTGNQLFKLTPNDAEPNDEFGNSIAIDNEIVAVGAWRADEYGDGSGAAYLFDATTGNQLDKLLPPTGNNYQTFGVSIAMDDGLVVIGARTFFDLNDGYTFAKAHLFDVSTGDQLNEFQPDILDLNGDQGGHFADAIDIDNGLIVVGAPYRSVVWDFSGATYVFNAATGEQLHFIFPDEVWDRDHFGISISIDNGVVAIGSQEDDDNGFDSGSAYLYDALTGNEICKLLASDGVEFDLFGTSVAIDGDVTVVGAKGYTESHTGSAYVYSGTTNEIIDISYNEDWNLVGLPLDVEDSGYSVLYPESIEGTLYSFSGAYNPATNLINGEGYWLRFNESGSTTIYGTPIYELTISLNEGWNLISGISTPLDITEIQDPDGLIIAGTIYGFTSGGYSNEEILEPGKGYWIRTNSSGSIILIDN